MIVDPDGPPGRPCGHEALVGRSASQDRQSRRRRYVQVGGRSPVRRQPLLRKALRENGRPRRSVTRAEEVRWETTRVGWDHQEAARRGRHGATCGHHQRETPLSREHHGQEPQPIYHQAALEANGLQQKRTVGATERDWWLRAAWRVMVAQRVDPARLAFVDEMGANTSLSVLRAWSRRGQRAYCSVPRNRGRTLPYWPA